MTKVRPPASFHDAIIRIAALIGWDGCLAALTTENRRLIVRTIRNWSDPDTGPCIPVTDALKLDLAFQAAGGIGTPLFDAYALQLEQETERARLSQPCLLHTTAASAKETGEAIEALQRSFVALGLDLQSSGKESAR